MHPLSVPEMIGVWERGESRSPLDKALLLLQAGQPETSLKELAQLTVGERDRRLMQLREQMLGSQLSCTAQCPSCKQDLEFEFDTSQIVKAPSLITTEPIRVSVDGISVTFRLPTSEDLIDALRSADSCVDMRRWMLARCALDMEKDGAVLEVDEIPEALLPRLCDQMGSSDPQADVRFSVQCLSCGQSWQTTFDVTSFFWKEISVRARRVLSEIHVLASAYGWSESDILSMSAARREFYLEMVSA